MIRRHSTLVAFAIVMIAGALGVYLVEHHQDTTLRKFTVDQGKIVAKESRHELFLSCVRGNGSRGMALLNSKNISPLVFKRALAFAPLLDCQATIFNHSTNHGVPLPLKEQLKFVDLVQAGKTPMVTPAGTVVVAPAP